MNRWMQVYVVPAAVFISVVMGGGYGTGREVVEFFTRYGILGGLLGIGVAACVFALVLACTYEFARVFQVYDYRTFFGKLIGPFWICFEILYLLLFLLVLGVVGSAAGNILEEEFGISSLVGMAGVLVLVIAVASFNIVSTLIMAVNEKQGDIAILKTMGAKPSIIMVTFMIQGLVNGVVGSAIGGASGVYLALNLTQIVTRIENFFGVKFLSGDVYFIDFLPTQLHRPDVIITTIVALLLSLLATLYPAWRATKVDPAQVLGQI